MLHFLTMIGEGALILFGMVFPAIALLYQYVWRPTVILRSSRSKAGRSTGRSKTPRLSAKG
jgi:hypothetical protein